jgi:uncharacterized protein (DUF1499 family)
LTPRKSGHYNSRPPKRETTTHATIGIAPREPARDRLRELAAGDARRRRPQARAPCPSLPHCASTQQLDGIPPAPYVTSEARARLVAILRAMPGAKIVTESPDYIRAEFTSRHFHYVDDFEVYFDDRAKLAQFRSSSRSGYYDFGVNKRRFKDIREQFVATQS